MARTDTLGNFLTDVAKSIKDKKGDQTAIKASDFDTEITNLPSGGSTSIYTINELAEIIDNFFELGCNPPLSNDNITLYTPDINYNKYLICNRYASKYRVVWFKFAAYKVAGNLIPSRISVGNGSTSYITGEDKTNFIAHQNAGDGCYYSPDFNSVEECINYLKSNASTYTYSGNAIGIHTDIDVFKYSNTPIYNSSLNQYVEIERLSSNETIEVIN